MRRRKRRREEGGGRDEAEREREFEGGEVLSDLHIMRLTKEEERDEK